MHVAAAIVKVLLCFHCATRETRTPMLTLRVRAPVDSVGGVYHAVSNCERLSEEFTADGRVVLRIAVELAQVCLPCHGFAVRL